MPIANQGRYVAFWKLGPGGAEPQGQFPTSRFICPNASDLPHGTVGKPLATRQELFSRTPLQPAKTGLLDGRAVIYSNPVDVMPERTYGTERYSAGQWEDRNRRVEVSGSAPQIPSGPNGPWDLDPPAPALNTSMPREDKAFAAQRVQAPRHLGRSRGQIGSTDLFRTKSVARTSGWACAISGG